MKELEVGPTGELPEHGSGRDLVSAAAESAPSALEPSLLGNPAPLAPADLLIPGDLSFGGVAGDVQGDDSRMPDPADEEESEEEARQRAVFDEEPEGREIGRISVLDLEKVGAVFVPSEYYKQEAEHLFRRVSGRIYLIQGQEHSGKLTCAIRLASELLGNPAPRSRPKIFLHTDRQGHIVELALAGRLEEQAIYIVEDAFAHQVTHFELMSPQLEPLQSALLARGSYLLLTSEPSTGEHLTIPKIDATLTRAELKEVFENHLHFYRQAGGAISLRPATADLAGGCWEDLKEDLTEPNQVDLFCYRLGLEPRAADRNVLVEIASRISGLRREATRPWFNGLRLDEKLYALLFVLLEGIGQRARFEIFALAIAVLRGDGLQQLRDPRRIGEEDLLDRLRLVPARAGEVVFQDRNYYQEVLQQAASHHHLLWSLVPSFVDLIERTADWQVRRALGSALGRIGIGRRGELRAVLERLAGSQEPRAAATVGFALTELYQADQGAHRWSAELLEDWVSSGNPSLMWTAGAAVWRLYGALAQIPRPAQPTAEDRRHAEAADRGRVALLKLTGRLATDARRVNAKAKEEAWNVAREGSRDDDEAKRRVEARLRAWAKSTFQSALLAVTKMAAIDPAEVVGRIRDWLAEDQQRELRRLAQAASRKLFETVAGAGGAPITPLRREMLLLCGPLLSVERDEVGAVRAMLIAIGRWASFDEGGRHVTLALVRVANRPASPRAAESFRTALAQLWLDCDTPPLQRLARSLIVRSLAVEGAAPHHVGGAGALLVLDTSATALGDGRRPLVQRLWRVLRARFEVAIARLGERAPIESRAAAMAALTQQDERLRPRLLVPVLAAVERRAFALIVVFAGGEVIDVEDAEQVSPVDRLVLISPSGVGHPTAWSHIEIDPEAPGAAIVALEREIDRICLMEFLGTNLQTLHSAARQDSPAGVVESEAVVTLLSSWIEQLDSALPGNPEDDLAVRILRMVLCLAGQDLCSCCRLLGIWLEGTGGGELAPRMGEAAGYLLLRLLSIDRLPPSAGALPQVLALCRRMVATGWRGAEAAFMTARHWLTDPAWVAELIGGADGQDGELARWIGALAPEHMEPLGRLLTGWMERPSGEAGAEAVRAAQRLRHLCGQRCALPAGLRPDQVCALVVIDGACDDGAARRRLAALGDRVIADAEASCPVLLYRLGWRSAIAVGGISPSREAFPPTQEEKKLRPRLLGPLLAPHSPASTACVLLLIAGDVLDLQDFSGTAWAPRIVCHDIFGHLPSPGFAQLEVTAGTNEAEAVSRCLNERRGA